MKSFIERYFQQRSFAYATLYSSIVNKIKPYEAIKPFTETIGDHAFDESVVSETVSTENLMFSAVHKWYEFGRNTFKISESLCDLLANTDVLDMHIDFRTLPYENFYIDFSSFPEYHISQNGSEHIFEGIFVHNLDASNFINFLIIKRAVDSGRLSGDMFFISLIDPSETISKGIENFKEIMKGWGWNVSSTTETMIEIGPLLFNTLIYLKSDNPDIKRINNESNQNLHKLKPDAKVLATINLLSTGRYKYFTVGEKYNINQTEKLHQSSKEKRTHWRRGHFRHYVNGKIIFVLPVKVRADRDDPLKGKDFSLM